MYILAVKVWTRPLGSRKPAHVGVKEKYPSKMVIYPLLACLACKMVADRHRHDVYHNKH